MKLLPPLFLILVSYVANGQNGYVKLGDSLLVGYLKYYSVISSGEIGLELWKDKRDKNPRRMLKSEVEEYAIKEDTFKVLHSFQPFPDENTYFETADAKVISTGKVNLYIIKDYHDPSTVTFALYGGGIIGGAITALVVSASMGNVPYIYVLEDSAGYIKALPAKEKLLNEALLEFFPEKYLLRYGELKERIKYKTVPDLVKLYNLKSK
jgi:hypothetical protein